MNSLINRGIMDFRYYNIIEFKSYYLIIKLIRYKKDLND